MAIYYVSTAGSPSNNGTSTSTPITLAELNTLTLVAGDQVKFNRGDVFYGELKINSSGSTSSKIEYGAYGTGSLPIISGFKITDGWSNTTGDIWETYSPDFGDKMHMVLMNDVVREKGRFPKDFMYRITSEGNGDTYIEAKGNLDLEENPAPEFDIPSGLDFTGAEVVIRKNEYIDHCLTVDSHSGDKVYYGSDLANPGTYQPMNKYGFFFQNHPLCLTELGDWRYDSATKKLYMCFAGSTPSAHVIKAATIDVVVDISNNSNIAFEDIRVEGADRDVFRLDTGSNNIDFYRVKALYGGNTSINLNGTSIDEILVHECELAYSHGVGFYGYFTNSNLTISNSHIHHIYTYRGSAGLFANSDHKGDGIGALFGPNVSVINNLIEDIGFNAVDVTGSNNLIDNNTIRRSNVLKNDGAGIYLTIGVENMTIEIPCIVSNNRIYDTQGCLDGTPVEATIRDSYILWGIYLDDNSNNIQVRNNYVIDCRGGGFYGNNARNSIIEDNYFIGCSRSVNWAIGNGTTLSGITYRRNTHIAMRPNEFFVIASSSANNFSTWGTFENNTYLALEDYKAPFEANYGQTLPWGFGMTFGEWATLMGETGSTYRVYGSVVPEEYTPVAVLGENTYSQESDVTSFGEFGAITYVAGGAVAWSNGKAKVTKASEVRASAYVTLATDIEENTAYVLTIGLSSPSPQNISVEFEHSYGSAYSYPRAKQVSPPVEEKTYKMYFSDKYAAISESVLLLMEVGSTEMSIDNLKLEEVDFVVESPITILTNDTGSPKTVTFTEETINVKTGQVVTSIVVQPDTIEIVETSIAGAPESVGINKRIPLWMIENFLKNELNFEKEVNFVLPPTSEINASEDTHLVKWSQVKSNNAVDIAYGFSKDPDNDNALRWGDYSFGDTLYTLGKNIPFRNFGFLTQSDKNEDVNMTLIFDKGDGDSTPVQMNQEIINFATNNGVGIEMSKDPNQPWYKFLIKKSTDLGYQAFHLANDGNMLIFDSIKNKGLANVDDFRYYFTDHSLVSKLFVETYSTSVENYFTYTTGDAQEFTLSNTPLLRRPIQLYMSDVNGVFYRVKTSEYFLTELVVTVPNLTIPDGTEILISYEYATEFAPLPEPEP